MTYFEIVMKLIGPVMPVGESNADDVRFENLQRLCDLTDNLIGAIDDVAYKNKDRVEYSMNRAGKFAAKVLTDRFGIAE